MSSTVDDRILVNLKAWNWVWPDEHNCFPIPARVRGPKPVGQHLPSKRTLAKRAARRSRARGQ